MNTAQRTFFQLLRNSHKALPSEYVELPYIINPSTAYINTGFIPSYSYKIEVEIENLTPNRDGYSCPFGGIVATEDSGKECHYYGMEYPAIGDGKRDIVRCQIFLAQELLIMLELN